MTKQPLISIITATYNAELFLQSSIDSVKNQTYKHFEYILIDGASTDGTVQILKENESLITFWISEGDTGIYNAWNKGLTISKGEWILFIGADDQLLPDTLQTYVDYINRYPENTFEYISSKVKRVRADGTTESIVGKPWEWSSFKKRMTTAHPGSFHSSQLFEKYGKYNENYKVVSDYELLLRPREKLKAGFIDKITVLMLVGGKYSAYRTTLEVIKMFKSSKHQSSLEYYVHSMNILVRYYLRTIFSTKK
jgi:glycosyltransferase involved in cell wall biosynthesis